MSSKFTMKLDMRVLQHLGIRLYSNVAAVISELVANCWDAEATRVEINFDPDNDRICISDNGVGMDVGSINDRFLTVGYEKRRVEGESSARFNRPFMGRKGIGKLSALSVADVVEVHTSDGRERSALRIDKAALEDAITRKVEYHPEEIAYVGPSTGSGTTLWLRKLAKRRLGATAAALRKRVARRFSVIGHAGTFSGDTFEVLIDGAKIGHADRDDLKSLEYLWEFGNASVPEEAVPGLHKRTTISDNKIPNHRSWEVRGWFGTARKPADLEQDDPGSMRNLIVIARGRLIQENILDKLGFNRIFGSYVTGVIEADFLDTATDDDIATSDRQRLIEDDPRVIELRQFLRAALVKASEDWGKDRRTKKADDAISELPALQAWINEIPPAQKAAAQSVIGLIGDLYMEDEEDRRNLYRAGILAFERLRLREAGHRLERLETLEAKHVLELFIMQDHFESALYADIVRTRIDAIGAFQGLTDIKAKETVLQTHLFENLWLLDAGWERAEGSETIEHRLARDYPRDFGLKLTDAQKRGRVDIKYRQSSGTHIIVELKKYEREITIEELVAQGKKYRAALHKLATQDGESDPRIEVVFVLGHPVKVDDSDGLPAGYVENQLRTINGRIFHYDQLIRNALKANREFLAAHSKADRVATVIEGLTDPSKLLKLSSKPLPDALPARSRIAKKRAAGKKGVKNRKAKGRGKPGRNGR